MTAGDAQHAPGASSIVVERPAVIGSTGDVTAGPSARWPGWARDDLEGALAAAAGAPPTAAMLYRDWFTPAAERGGRLPQRPLVGLYRSSHAASGAHREDGYFVADRNDVLGADGWWRTWGERWTPPRHRPGSARLYFTPRRDRLGEFVHTVTSVLGRTEVPWSLSCASDARRMRRVAGATLDLPDADLLPDGLLERLAPALHPVRPPLTLPLAEGVGLVAHPSTWSSFGEHRCHLVALALRHPSAAGAPLRAIAAVFAAHGVDPARPYL